MQRNGREEEYKKGGQVGECPLDYGATEILRKSGITLNAKKEQIIFVCTLNNYHSKILENATQACQEKVKEWIFG